MDHIGDQKTSHKLDGSLDIFTFVRQILSRLSQSQDLFTCKTVFIDHSCCRCRGGARWTAFSKAETHCGSKSLISTVIESRYRLFCFRHCLSMFILQLLRKSEPSSFICVGRKYLSFITPFSVFFGRTNYGIVSLVTLIIFHFFTPCSVLFRRRNYRIVSLITLIIFGFSDLQGTMKYPMHGQGYQKLRQKFENVNIGIR